MYTIFHLTVETDFSGRNAGMRHLSIIIITVIYIITQFVPSVLK